MEITRNFQNILSQRLLEKNNNLMQVVLGPRQVGKTTALKSICKNWDGNVVYESADSFEPLTVNWIANHWRNALQLGNNTLLVIDEVQKIPNWSEAIKKLYDENLSKELKIVLLGSASLKIQKGLQDSLAGRYELIKAPHWSFSETQKAFNWNFEKYLMFGGYPKAENLTDDILRWQDFIKNSIVENVLTKDLAALAEVRHPALLRQIFYIAMGLPAMEISFQKMVGQLQDKGALGTVKSYLELLENAHLLRILYKYSTRVISTRSSSPKILPLAPALINAINGTQKLTENLSWKGRVFESAIGSFLNNISDELYYWRDGNIEVDFIASINNQIFAIEVKSGANKNSSGLEKFLSLHRDAIGIIIDWDKGQRLLSLEDSSEIRKNPKLLISL